MLLSLWVPRIPTVVSYGAPALSVVGQRPIRHRSPARYTPFSLIPYLAHFSFKSPQVLMLLSLWVPRIPTVMSYGARALSAVAQRPILYCLSLQTYQLFNLISHPVLPQIMSNLDAFEPLNTQDYYHCVVWCTRPQCHCAAPYPTSRLSRHRRLFPGFSRVSQSLQLHFTDEETCENQYIPKWSHTLGFCRPRQPSARHSTTSCHKCTCPACRLRLWPSSSALTVSLRRLLLARRRLWVPLELEATLAHEEI
ncbi:hypothetical protein BDZ89DRAFT_638345 [Hymenopellis radicata]|nr:hypothetical protein BDZ89DRAFT_638345 [Hymenopellis radicata]